MRAHYLLYLIAISGLSIGWAKLRLWEPAEVVALDHESFLLSAVVSANMVRSEASLAPLETSKPLQHSIRAFAEANRDLGQSNLQSVFAHVEASLPQVHELSANLVYAKEEEQLIAELSKWSDLNHKEHSHYAVWIFRDQGKRRLGCLAMLARQLPNFELPMHADSSGAYFATCKLCDQGHGISLGNQGQNTLILTCPNCQKPYDIIATDSSGQWRRANQFFTGIRSEATSDDSRTMEQLMAIWKDVARKCRYQYDAKRISGGDSWESPIDTYRVGSGDCEDTSLLLVDMLIGHGFDARVALGRHDREGHAWAVVNLEGEQYILESTWEHVDRLSSPPSMNDVGLEYQPEYLFDREAIYFKNQSGWTCEYWADSKWTQVHHGLSGSTEVASLDG